MKITCSIICYNYGRYLAQAIESCLTQQPGDYKLEVLVIDDGSTDETSSVCQYYQSHIWVIRSENQGFGASLDKAICEASGEYVCLLDADDYFAPEKLVTLLPWMREGYLYIQNSKYEIDRDGKPTGNIVKGGSTGNLCLNRAAALTLLPAQNEIFFHPLNAAGCGVELDNPLTAYRVHESSWFTAGLWWQHIIGREREAARQDYLAKVTHALADRLFSIAQQPPKWARSKLLLEKISRDYRAQAYYNELEAALELGEWKNALRSCLKMLLTARHSKSGISKLYYKMIVKTMLGRPSFPRKVNKV